MEQLNVGVVYTLASALSREDEQLARYIALCLSVSGRCAKSWLVGMQNKPGRSQSSQGGDTARHSVAVRCDGVVLDSRELSREIYEETDDWKVLEKCQLWILLLDADTTIESVEFLQKKLGKSKEKQQRVVMSLQTAMRRLAQLNAVMPDSVVLHGGAAFQVVKDGSGALRPLSNGCFFVERLSKEKTSALFALDALEGIGIQVLSRQNIQALKWGCTMLRSFYYINALTGVSVLEGLRDRKTRFLFLQALVEMDKLFEIVLQSVAAASSKANSKGSNRGGAESSHPDTSAATLFPVRSIMVLLPLPNWIFNFFALRLLDLGLGAPSDADKSVIMTDLEAMPLLQTNFETEFRDIFELAAGRNLSLPVLKLLRSTFTTAGKQREQAAKDGGSSRKTLRIDSGVLLAQVELSPQITAASRTFFLKVFVTFVLTLLLGLYLFVW
ncbi:hypothetical protein PHYBOEH_002598 [Phytophthora boehmeriae]|uniref:Uncharacterized protein n=1 Tax=Phytophthora boehmeriae TaxID=109152 RepID=A0A8T1WVF1_9STRA|nr:hypothetical protein PHYBOEH_002598 [Phytophthora boehmeriae]